MAGENDTTTENDGAISDSVALEDVLAIVGAAIDGP